jgi:hypothetical protein
MLFSSSQTIEMLFDDTVFHGDRLFSSNHKLKKKQCNNSQTSTLDIALKVRNDRSDAQLPGLVEQWFESRVCEYIQFKSSLHHKLLCYRFDTLEK